jgi:hypothetical protein
MAPAPSARPRDPRLDFFRGVGMFIILIAHITDNPWTLWIPARFGFSDATEMFVFCSGMASAVAFGGVFARAGWWLGTLRILHRIWQVYWVHIGVFLATLALMHAIDASGWFQRNEVQALNLTRFQANQGPFLLGLFTLTYVPNYFDILPMYLVILAMIPAMVALARVDGRLALAVSVLLWLAAEVFGLHLPAEAWAVPANSRPWFFNPFGWQLVFFTGFALMAGWVPPPPVRGWLVALAIAVVVVSVPFAWHRVLGAYEWARAPRQAAPWLFDKTDFGLLRYVHFLALAYLAWVAAGPQGVRLARGVPLWRGFVALVTRVGQQSLPVFAVSMVTARGLGAILDAWGYGVWATLAVNAMGAALVIAVAWVAGTFKREPWKQPREVAR